LHDKLEVADWYDTSTYKLKRNKTVVLTHKTNQPVAIKASALANKSGIVNFDNTISKTIPAIIPIARRPCRNRTKVGRVVDFFGVAVKSWPKKGQKFSLELVHTI
jgi:hypothetical protein